MPEQGKDGICARESLTHGRPQVVRWALGVSTLGVIAAGLKAQLGGGLTPFVLILAVIILMVVLMIVAAASKLKNRGPALVIVWTVTAVFVFISAAFVSAILFGYPRNLSRILTPGQPGSAQLVPFKDPDEYFDIVIASLDGEGSSNRGPSFFLENKIAQALDEYRSARIKRVRAVDRPVDGGTLHDAAKQMAETLKADLIIWGHSDLDQDENPFVSLSASIPDSRTRPIILQLDESGASPVPIVDRFDTTASWSGELRNNPIFESAAAQAVGHLGLWAYSNDKYDLSESALSDSISRLASLQGDSALDQLSNSLEMFRTVRGMAEVLAQDETGVFVERQSDLGVLLEAEILRKQHRLEEAIKIIDDQIKPSSPSGLLLSWKGKFLVLADKNEKAIGVLNQAIDLHPNFAVPRFFRGKALVDEEQDYDLAVEDLSYAIDAKFNLAESHLRRSIAYERLGRLAESEADIDECVRLTTEEGNTGYGESAPVHYQQGSIKMKLFKYEEAAESFWQAYTRDESKVEALGDRVVASVFAGACNDAFHASRTLFKRCEELGDTDEGAKISMLLSSSVLVLERRCPEDAQAIAQSMSKSESRLNMMLGLALLARNAELDKGEAIVKLSAMENHQIAIKMIENISKVVDELLAEHLARY